MREEEVLEALKPCLALVEISISGYLGRKPPSWLKDTWLTSLKSIELGHVNMENLPPCLSKMPLLKSLYITGAPNLKEMRWRFQQAIFDSSASSSVAVLFPMLEVLHLVNMSACEGWQIEEEADGKPPACVILPKLKYLTLRSCPHLEECSYPIQAPVLEILDISRVPHRFLNNFQAFPCLSSLQLEELLPSRSDEKGNEVKSLQASLLELANLIPSSLLQLTITDIQEMDDDLFLGFLSSSSSLTSLRTLHIDSCQNITACCLPMALDLLYISGCHQIASFWLSSLAVFIDNLCIMDCPSLVSFGTNHSTDGRPKRGYYCPRQLSIFTCCREQLSRLLHGIYYTNLEILVIGDCSDITHFDDDAELKLSTALLHLISLKSLKICGCKVLKSLPPSITESLLSLEEIKLQNCPLLSSLPDLRPLPSLRELVIQDCPQLENSPELALLISSEKNLVIKTSF